MYLKKVYHDDPTFKDAKVFYSLFNEDKDFAAADSLGVKYAGMAAQEDVSEADAEVYGSGSYADVHKGALSYTDVVVMADDNLNKDVLQFVEDQKIRVFKPESAEDYENFATLYEEFASEEVEA